MRKFEKGRCIFKLAHLHIAKLSIYFGMICALLFSCNSSNQKTANQIDSLKNQIQLLTPGLGEYMLQVKYHHDALGEALRNYDTARAWYECGELEETFQDAIRLNVSNEKLRQPLDTLVSHLIFPVIDSLDRDFMNHNLEKATVHYDLLTEHCNTCHEANNMRFMKIIP